MAISDELRSLEDLTNVSDELIWAKVCINGMVPVYSMFVLFTDHQTLMWIPLYKKVFHIYI